jgi:hypothetical protein
VTARADHHPQQQKFRGRDVTDKATDKHALQSVSLSYKLFLRIKQQEPGFNARSTFPLLLTQEIRLLVSSTAALATPSTSQRVKSLLAT